MDRRGTGTAVATISFVIEPEVANLGIKALAFVVNDISIPRTSTEFEAELRAAEERLLATSTEKSLKTEPTLKGFRDLHAAVGPAARAEIAAPEALLRLLHRRGHLPRINLLVDIYNMVSADARLAIGAHDMRYVEGDVRLAATTGAETFTPIGAPKSLAVPAGEYAYMDEKDVLCRLEVRQCDRSKVTEQTTSCLLIVHGGPGHTRDVVVGTAHLLSRLVTKYCGGSTGAFLSGDN